MSGLFAPRIVNIARCMGSSGSYSKISGILRNAKYLQTMQVSSPFGNSTQCNSIFNGNTKNSWTICSTRHLSSVEGSQADAEATLPQEQQDTVGLKLMKIVGRLGGFYSKSSVLTRSAMAMYKCCVEGINYEDFFRACGMPDTFQSWFLINQLHIWMCLVRLKREGKDGQYLYRKLVSIMWQDVEARMKIMGQIDSTVVRESLHELVQEFYGLIFAYDEGLLSHDRVLAAALWRNMFHDNRTDAVQLASMVEYVRRQVQHLDGLDSKEILETGQITWLPLRMPKQQEPFLYHTY
ncbi:ubiquinol-cytochrome-c reductase complex assembly factor 1 [Nematostella vectensis]|uniref:ubiquinol-cytochrome-c reductase complex assembly factor 1 n=1 Tax=Nematostella vectensis TaxID=45351 RepID=UPI002076F8B0|nr:ubiquinol-cytochrome-c reductase complex assembly factor 1 [Nematostella vectensis]